MCIVLSEFNPSICVLEHQIQLVYHFLIKQKDSNPHNFVYSEHNAHVYTFDTGTF